MGDSIKIAVCIFGQMRTYNRCFPSLSEFILSKYDTDVFVHTWKNRGGTWKQSTNEKVNDEIITYSDLNEIYSPQSAKIEEFQEDFYYSLNGKEVPESVMKVEEFHKGLLPMFYKIKSVISLKNNYEERKDFTYDYVVLIRPDIYLLQGIPDHVLENPNVLWVNGRSPYRIDDQFFISSSSNIDYVASIWDVLNQYWYDEIEDDYGEMGIPEGYTTDDFVHMGVPERILHYHLKQSFIDVLPHNINCTPPVRIDDTEPMLPSTHSIWEIPVMTKRAWNIIREDGVIELLIRGLRKIQ